MKYAVYFQWNDGFTDSFNCDNAKERDANINDMLRRKEFKEIHYCPIYRSGEYGADTQVIGDRFAV